MTSRPFAVACVISLALLVTACGSQPESASTASSPTSSPSQSTASTTPEQSPTSKPAQSKAVGTAVTPGDSDYGPVLFAANNQAIYIWELETSTTPECYDDCAEAWPPVLTNGPPVAQGNVEAALLGTTRRSDGTTQVTYNGHPLYYYAHEAPGEVKCHNIATHGGIWWAVQPSGNPAP